MGISTKDRQYMRMALELAEKGRGGTSPNPMVGAVLVKDDAIVGQGYHRKAGEPHAEIEAIQDAGSAAQGAVLYLNLEPCDHHGRTAPCTDAIIAAGVSRVVAAMVDPNPLVSGGGLRRLKEADIEVDCGVLEGEARRLNEAFLTFQIKRRPFVMAKWAMTLDGRTSADSGDSRWISNDESRAYAHELRASVDAVAVGVGTVFFDNPKLNVRLNDFHHRQPKRIIFDGRLRTPSGAKCLDQDGGETIIISTGAASAERLHRLEKKGCKILTVSGKGRNVDVQKALEILGREEGIQSILVEGGRQLHTALLNARLIDKLVVFIGNRIVGGSVFTSPTIDLGIQQVKKAMSLKNPSMRFFKDNICIDGYLNLPPKPKATHPF